METVQVSDELASAITLKNIDSSVNTITLANVDTTAGDDITDGTARTITGPAGSLTVNLGGSEAGNQSHLGNTLTMTKREWDCRQPDC